MCDPRVFLSVQLKATASSSYPQGKSIVWENGGSGLMLPGFKEMVRIWGGARKNMKMTPKAQDMHG